MGVKPLTLFGQLLHLGFQRAFIGQKLLRRVYVAAAEQPCFVCDGVHLHQVVFQKIVKPCIVLLFLLWQDAELVAVMEVQSVETAYSADSIMPGNENILAWLSRFLLKRSHQHTTTVLRNTLHDPVPAVLLTQTVEADGLCLSLGNDCPILVAAVEIKGVAHLFQSGFKLELVGAALNSLVESSTKHIVSGRHTGTIFHGQIGRVRVSFWILDYMKPILLADSICDFAESEP